MENDTHTAWRCFDCGLVTNRPDVEEGYQVGWEKPWTLYSCPECGEALSEGTFAYPPNPHHAPDVRIRKVLASAIGLIEHMPKYGSVQGPDDPGLGVRTVQDLRDILGRT